MRFVSFERYCGGSQTQPFLIIYFYEMLFHLRSATPLWCSTNDDKVDAWCPNVWNKYFVSYTGCWTFTMLLECLVFPIRCPSSVNLCGKV